MPSENTTTEKVKPPSQRFGTNKTPNNTDKGNGHNGIRVRDQQKANEKDEQETASEKSQTCPECGGTVIHDEHHGDASCEDCGLVVDEQKIDHGPEWRAYNSSERQQKSRVGAPATELMHDKGLSTTIDFKDQDSNGNYLSQSQRKKMRRLRKWDTYAKTENPQDRTLRKGLNEILRMASALGIPKEVRKMAAMIFKGALKKDLIRGRSIEAMTSAALYGASKQSNIPRSLDEITNVSRVERNEIARAYRYTNRELSLNIEPADPNDYIPRFVSEIDATTRRTETIANRLIDKLSEDPKVMSGKSPTGLAAAAIYLGGKLSGEIPTQTAISEVSGVTEVTIRDRMQDILDVADESWLYDDVL